MKQYEMNDVELKTRIEELERRIALEKALIKQKKYIDDLLKEMMNAVEEKL